MDGTWKFLVGMGAGAAVSTMVGSMMRPKKTNLQKTAGKALKTVGQVVENLSDNMT